jgi:hypothetical protein
VREKAWEREAKRTRELRKEKRQKKRNGRMVCTAKESKKRKRRRRLLGPCWAWSAVATAKSLGRAAHLHTAAWVDSHFKIS